MPRSRFHNPYPLTEPIPIVRDAHYNYRAPDSVWVMYVEKRCLMCWKWLPHNLSNLRALTKDIANYCTPCERAYKSVKQHFEACEHEILKAKPHPLSEVDTNIILHRIKTGYSKITPRVCSSCGAIKQSDRFSSSTSTECDFCRTHRTCACCGALKSSSVKFFPTDPNGPEGLSNTCLMCQHFFGGKSK